MERSKSQILFNFLKNDTFDYEESGVIGKVNSIIPDPNSTKLPGGYIRERIQPQLNGWQNPPNFNTDTNIVVPSSVEFEIFPRTFECGNNDCKMLTTFSRSEFKQFQNNRSTELSCANPNCSHSLSARDQLQLVNVCRCGQVDSLYIPENGQFRLERSSQGLASSKLVSADGSDSIPVNRVNGECRECGAPADKQEVKVHSAGPCFYPQRATFVNIDREEIDLIQRNSRYREDLILEHISPDVDSEPKSATEALDDSVQGLLDKLGVSEEQVEEARREQRQEEEAKREEAKEFLEENFCDEEQTAISSELFELKRLQGDEETGDEVYAHSLSDLRERAEMDTLYDRQKVDEFLDLRDELGVKELRLMENFPITTAVYGYSRLSFNPDGETELNSFSGERGNEIYAQTAEAEAVQVTLDLPTVYTWLQSHPFVDTDSVEDPDDTYELRRWFLQQISSEDESLFPFHDDVARRPAVKHAVLTLMHSYAHTLINGIDALSGYSRDSLVEYHLPRSLSFVVYKRSDTDFSLGAIFTLIEDRFDELVEQVRQESQDCMYDPVCASDDGHACEGCLYLSNLSCQYGNNTLSRALLFGGEYQNRQYEGYLDFARRRARGG